MHSPSWLPILSLFTCLLSPTWALADPPLYERDVAPILQTKCGKCHSAKTQKADLDLSSLAGLRQGGESGAILDTDTPEESYLLELIRDGAMPPEDEPALTSEELATLEKWITGGMKSKAPPASATTRWTNHHVEPLMLLRCAVCHGLRTQEAGLDLRTKASMLRGGKSGPAIVLGDPDKSLLLQRIHQGEMPPPEKMIRAGVKPITTDEIARVAEWIRNGAPEVQTEPDVAGLGPDPLVTEEDRQFWAFQPPRDAAPPEVRNRDQVRSPIDAFLLRQLEARELRFAPEAARQELARRAAFDLTGLPPERDALQRFLEDDRPGAYERFLDELLASPRYGERWGRIWLDLSGYADSEGKRSADPIRPYAYKYRDYVIRSFNSDKSYARFLTEQLAGDELADYREAEAISPEMSDNLVATGFLRMAPDGTGSDIVNSVAERLEVISDEIDIFSSAILGLTVKCARCHSHKYDPIPQRDYYRLAAIFKGAFDEHDWLKPSFVPGQTKDVKPGRVLPLGTAAELREVQDRNRRIESDIAKLTAKKNGLAASIREEHLRKRLTRLPESIREDVAAALRTAEAKRTEVQGFLSKRFASDFWLSDSDVKKQPGYARAATEIDRQVKSLESEKRDGVQIRALWDRGSPSPTYIYVRGDHRQVGRLVGPGVPSVLTDGDSPFVIEPPYPGADSTGRRLALARWLTQNDHPLTARVLVNRIWKHHFGRGIVSTLSNFGKLGARPTHPDLLDWLAIRFVQDGWSIKSLHRRVMTSTAYRQSSRVDEQQLRLDPANELFSRMPLRRLEAEELRDALLLVSGRLSEQPFGRPDLVDARKDGLVTSQPVAGEAWRRSIYVRQRRKEIPTILATFDLPQMNPNCIDRVHSNVAQQALHLMNDSLVHRLSEAFAERVMEYSADQESRIRFAYLEAFSRPPEAEDLTAAAESLDQLRAAFADMDEPNREKQEAKTWTVFCHTLFNAAEFLYID